MDSVNDIDDLSSGYLSHLKQPHLSSQHFGYIPFPSTVDFGYSGHGYSGHLDIVATLAGTESFPIISSLHKPLIVAIHLGYSGHLTGIIILKHGFFTLKRKCNCKFSYKFSFLLHH